jgi:four helix bundle protein
MSVKNPSAVPLRVADFKKLFVWQKAHTLSLGVHRATRRMRSAEFSSLRSQTFRASMSIGANIAEGRRQNNDKQFARFLGYALNSASELEHHLIVARDLGAVHDAEFRSLVSETIRVRKMLYALIRRVSVANPDPSANTNVPASPKPTAG